MPRLIGLYSPAPGSGKTAIANYLNACEYKTVSFAAPLKRMVALLLTECGYSEESAHRLVHYDKEKRLPLLNTTPRHMLQTLGTEYGRDCIHPQIWVMCAERAIGRLHAQNTKVVVDDVRFPNEANAIRKLGGELWYVHRPGTERATEHRSEGSLDSWPLFDRRIDNSGTLLDLFNTIKSSLLTDAPHD